MKMAASASHRFDSVSLPVILVIVSLLVLMGFLTYEAVQDREALLDLQRAQEPTIQQAIKVRQQLETLAGGTTQLATEGDENAKAIVDEMKRQGVTLSQPKK
jgi:F0F1-type ATP synthase membrane subunit b/b'